MVVVAVILAAAVTSAVHHAEVIAHRVGEPFGSLILAVAVTIIEVGLIITLMTSGSGDAATLARDTVFAAVMITVNGIIGLSLLTRTRGGKIARFNAEGSGTALATVATLATLTLVLPPSPPRPRPGVQRHPARLRRRRITRPLRLVRARADDPPPRLLPARRPHHRRRPRRSAEHQRRLRERRPARRRARLGRRAREGREQADRGRRHQRGAAAGVRRRDHRAARPRPRIDRRRPRRLPRPNADEPQPRARISDRQHRPHHPRDRRRQHLARRAPRARPRPDADGAPRDQHARRRPHDRPGRATLQQATVHLVLFASFLVLAINP